ncbi:MAG: TIM barrel protein [Planctomycetota bacterium]
MLEFALSTVAVPHLPLAEAVALAERAGYDAIDLRTFGFGSDRFASDPALTDEAKTRTLIDASGIDCSSLSTGVRLDEPITPPIIGRALFDNERQIREGKLAVDLAAQIDTPLVRVFGFDRHGNEDLKQTAKRVAWRLGMVCDHARNTGVRVVLENGGVFATAEALAEMIDRVNSPLLGACYNAAVGRASGDDPAGAIATLADKLLLARVKDHSEGVPVQLGQGELAPEDFVAGLADSGTDITVVFEWDAAWFEGIPSAHDVVGDALQLLCSWSGQVAPDRLTA